MINEIFKFLSHLIIASEVVASIVYLAHANKSTKAIHILGGLVIFSALSSGANLLTIHAGGTSFLNFNVFRVIQFLLLSWFFYEIYFKKQDFKIWCAGVSIFILTFVYITFFSQNFFTEYQGHSWATGDLIILIYSLIYCSVVLQDYHTFSLRKSLILINAGIVIEFGFGLYIDFMAHQTLAKQDPETARLTWSFFMVSVLVKYILFTIGIHWSRKEAVRKQDYFKTG